MALKDIFIKVDGTTAGMRREVDALGKSFAKNEKNVKQFNNSLGNMGKDATSGSKAFGQLSSSMAILGGKMYLVTKLAQGLAVAVQSAMDTVESVNLFNVAMGDLAESTDSFVQFMHEASGLDTTNLRDAVGTFGLLARSMGIAGDNAQTLSTNSVKLALDLGSLTNVPFKQVLRDLRSGLVGQSETMYKYGVDVTEAALKQTAFAEGITKSVRNMSQGEKVALRYQTILRQTALAHGDFAKTINEPANQMRILVERIVSLGRAIGSVFIPLLSFVLPILNRIIKRLTDIIEIIALLFGYTPPKIENVKNAVGSFGDTVDDATDSVKKLKNATIGLDELNVISETGGLGGFDGGKIQIDLDSYNNQMEQLKTDSDKVWDELVADGKEWASKVGQTVSTGWDNIITEFKTRWESGEIQKIMDETNVPYEIGGYLQVEDAIDVKSWQDTFEVLGKGFKDWKSDVKTGWDELVKDVKANWKVMKKDIDERVKLFKEEWNKFKEWFSNGWKAMWNGIGNFFIGIGNGIISSFEWMVNKIIDGVNWVIEKVNALIHAIPEPIKHFLHIGDFSFDLTEHVDFGRLPYLDSGKDKVQTVAPANQGGFGANPYTRPNGQGNDMIQAVYDVGGQIMEATQSRSIENVIEIDGEVLYDSVENTRQQKGYGISTVRSALV